MPSVRELASRLVVNPNTIARVYRDLEREGLLETRRGQGTYVSGGVAALVESERRRLIADRMRLVAGDVREFGMEPHEALLLFSEVLDDTHRDGGASDDSE
jgi:GntR family transcriptional regulator